jgi:hypothetical protein
MSILAEILKKEGINSKKDFIPFLSSERAGVYFEVINTVLEKDL